MKLSYHWLDRRVEFPQGFVSFTFGRSLFKFDIYRSLEMPKSYSVIRNANKCQRLVNTKLKLLLLPD